MKIIHVSNVHSFNNYRVFDREVKTLADNSIKVSFIAPHKPDFKYNNVDFLSVENENSEFRRALFVGYRLFKKVLKFPKDSIVHFHSPEFIPYAILLKISGRKVFYDVHEDVPRQIYTKVWLPNILKPLFSIAFILLEKLGLWLFDQIIACEPVTFNRFKSKKTVLLRNFPISEEFNSNPQYNERENQVIYIGQITKERGIDKLVEAFGKVKKNELQFVLGGKCTPDSFLDELKKIDGWKKVDYKGEMTRNEVIKELYKSKIGLLILNPIRKYKESYPVKLFEYMAGGVPILMSNFNHWKESINGKIISEYVETNQSDEIARKIDSMFDNESKLKSLSAAALEAYKTEYNWDSEKVKLLNLYSIYLNGK